MKNKPHSIRRKTQGFKQPPCLTHLSRITTVASVMQTIRVVLAVACSLAFTGCQSPKTDKSAQKDTAIKRPNILFVISDDQSHLHASAYGSKLVSTPTFDRLAAEGVLFLNAFAAAPQCSPSRAAILTGRNIWQLEEAGTHGSLFPKKFPVFTEALARAGYLTGYTGKPWGPGNWEQAGWETNPVGREYNTRTLDSVPYSGLSTTDYKGNFQEFLKDRKQDQPFFFWFGAKEPHRDYEPGSGERQGKDINQAKVPGFLPDVEAIRRDLLDYGLEIEWFDEQLSEVIALLKATGEYENTIIVVTSDNGMPFPGAKANLQEWGTHVPLLISGPGMGTDRNVAQGKRQEALVGLIDLAPTLLTLAGVPLTEMGEQMAGKNLLPLLLKETRSSHKEENTETDRKKERQRNYVLTGRERHTHARPDNLGYPCRAIRTAEFLYIKNFKPERWPAGDPPPPKGSPVLDNEDFKPIGEGYADIDGSPTKDFMISARGQYPDLFKRSFLKRSSEELYDIKNDPYCLTDLSGDAAYDSVRRHLEEVLFQELTAQKDPRLTGDGDIFESYPRFGRMRNFAGFKERGAYNSKFSDKK